MTHGDINNVKCPACRIPFSPKACGVRSPQTGGFNQIVEMEIHCPNCRKPLHVWARMVEAVECEREEKVK